MSVNPFEIRQRDSVYRRGVLLGMTMAEIMILILFCLLMAFVLRLETYEEKIEAADNAEQLIDALEQEVGNYDDTWELLSSLKSIVANIGADTLAEVIEVVEQHPDLTSLDVVKAVEQGLSRYAETMAALANAQESAPTPEDVTRALAEQTAAVERAQENAPAMEALDSIRAQVEQATGEAPTPQALKDAVQQMLAEAQAWRAADVGDVTEAYEITLLENQDLKERMGRVDKALAKAVKQLQGKGRGLQYPSCFETPDGKTQFVFDIVFDESSVRLTPLPVPGNEERWTRLKFDQITTGKAIPVKQYLDETRPVFNWSEANACRFFVRIEDHTQAMNKSQYKVMKRYIEYHFYTYEAPQPAPPATVVSAAL